MSTKSGAAHLSSRREAFIRGRLPEPYDYLSIHTAPDLRSCLTELPESKEGLISTPWALNRSRAPLA
jgi:hypothetical protein